MSAASEYNGEQQRAVKATEGYIRVIAGAGSGKTRALSGRFAYLVNELGVLPGGILCVTFTNKSANEMRERIRALTGDSDTGYISTFHSFCVTVLQEDSNAVQYPKSFLVLDNADIDSMLNLIYEERGLTLRHMTFSRARDMIEIRKTITEPKYYEDMIAMSQEQLKKKYLSATRPEDIIFYGYLWQEKKCFALDYNDLIKFTLYIFENDSVIREKWQSRLEYIMIDEFQDIDELQYSLMKALCGYHHNLFIVGDPDQTIYTWRGANVKYLLDFDKAFPDVETIMMMKNYRSAPGILTAANALISKNRARMEKELIPTLSGEEKPEFFHAPTAEAEALWIAKRIKELDVPLREVAVLYRAHYVTRALEEAFLKEELPYVIYSGVQFFARAEIKDALSYLRLIVYKDDLSFLRIANVPKRNIGERRISYLKERAERDGRTLYETLKASLDEELFKSTGARAFIHMIDGFSAAYQNMAVSGLLAEVLEKSGYEELLRTEGSQERLDNLAELKQAVYEYETTCGEESTAESYLSRVALFTGQDADDRRQAVKLMTVHAAKGLEFPFVFLCGMDEGIFPSRKTSTLEAMEEERRLAFVAVTRAKKGLFLSDCEGKNHDGTFRYPSRFIFDMEDTVMHLKALPESLVAGAGARVSGSMRSLRAAKGAVFAEGERVVHSVFGAGIVVLVDKEHSAYLIKFDKLVTPRRISFSASLEKET